MRRKAVATFVLALATPQATRAAERVLASRSLYVPVAFRLCEHLSKATLSENGQVVAVLPAERTFLFTYYPDLERVAPEVIQLRIEGTYAEGGDPFVARLAVTREGLHTARDHILLDTGKDAELFRARHRDVRHASMDFFVRCDRFCSRKKGAALTN